MPRYAKRYILLDSLLHESYAGPEQVLSNVIGKMRHDVESYLHRHTNLPVEQRVAYHMEHCVPSEFTTYVRPWPRAIGESSLNGYDRLVPRTGIEIIVETEVQ